MPRAHKKRKEFDNKTLICEHFASPRQRCDGVGRRFLLRTYVYMGRFPALSLALVALSSASGSDDWYRGATHIDELREASDRLQEGTLDEHAFQTFVRQAERAPDDWRGHAMLGQAQTSRGSHQAAVASLKRARKLAPDVPQADAHGRPTPGAPSRHCGARSSDRRCPHPPTLRAPSPATSLDASRPCVSRLRRRWRRRTTLSPRRCSTLRRPPTSRSSTSQSSSGGGRRGGRARRCEQRPSAEPPREMWGDVSRTLREAIALRSHAEGTGAGAGADVAATATSHHHLSRLLVRAPRPGAAGDMERHEEIWGDVGRSAPRPGAAGLRRPGRSEP